MELLHEFAHQLFGGSWTSVTTFATLATSVSFLAGILYIFSTVRGKTVPHPFTWIAATLLTGISLFLFLKGGGEEAGLMMVGDFVVILCIAILSIFRWREREKEFELEDKLAFVGALSAIALYVFSQNAAVGFAATIVAGTLSTIPTLRKAYAHPEEEDFLAWTLGFSGDAINALAIQTFMDGLYVWSSYALNGAVWATLLGKGRLFSWSNMKAYLAKRFPSLPLEEDAVLYTSIEEAREEIWRRWNDEELKKKVLEYLGGDVPEFFLKSPMSVLARNIATPMNETVRFLEVSTDLGVSPIVLEYAKDTFTTENLAKYYLGKIMFSFGKSLRGEKREMSYDIVDFAKAQEKPLDSIPTAYGENLLNLHHQFFSYSGLDGKIQTFDMSEWCKRRGKGSAEYFYEDFLSLFVCFGVLCENFLLDGSERKLTINVVFPSFRKVCDRFGVKPLVIRLIPKEKESDEGFWCHPKYLKKFLKSETCFSNGVALFE